MAEMKWNLENWLETHRVTRYELAQNMGGNVKTRLTSLYRMRDPKRIDLSVMGEIVSALRHITGEDVTPNDLLEFVPNPEPVDDQAALLATGTAGLGEALHDLEQGVPPEELAAWRDAFTHERAE
jgi:DNA-binding Xre family transcriptional regulator